MAFVTMFSSWILILLGLVAATNGEVSFIALGDWGDTALPGQAGVASAMNEWAEEHRPEFIISTGDNFYPWGAFSPTDPQFEFKWRSMYNGSHTGHLPWLISIGNHDYGRDLGEEWNQVEFAKTEPRWIFPHIWHDFLLKEDDFSIHFIAIDTECLRKQVNNHTAMVPWLEERLQEHSDATWTIVYGHRPIYSVGNYGPWSGTIESQIQPVLEKYGVEIFLCGHDHNLQHLSKVNEQPGIDYILSGGGGALWYSYDPEAADTLLQERGIAAHHFSMTWGFIGFRADKDKIVMEFVNTNNDVIYSYTRQK